MSLKRHAITLLTALLLSSVAPTLYAQVRVAVVDLQRALNQTEDGRRAKQRLKKLFERRQVDLDKAQNDLKKMKADIERQQDVLSKNALQKRVETYQKAVYDLQQQYMEYQRELAQKEAKLTKRILERMYEIVQRIGQAEGYTTIVERNEGGVIWVPSNLDITDQVIQRYNSERGSGGSMMGMGMGGM